MTRSIAWIACAITSIALACVATPAKAVLLLGGQTMAGGAPATSSDINGDASRVNDGRLANGTANEWTNVADGASFTIDLGKQYRMSDLNLLNGLNFNDRQTRDFTVHMSTTGSFAGEQQLLASSTAQAKSLGFQDVSLPAFSNPTNNPNLVGRYVRFTAVNHALGAGQFGPGVAELTMRGVTDRGTGALAPVAQYSDQIDAKAYTRTVNLTDTAPANYVLRLLTPTSGSVVQSLGASYTVTGNTFFGNGNVTDNTNNGGGAEVVWNSPIINDLSQGYLTVDLGQEMIIDGLNLRNSTSTSNDRGTKTYLIRVSNDPTFAEQNNTEVLVGTFSAIGATDSPTLTSPLLGRYIQFLASDFYGFSAGLDDLTVFGRTFTSQTLLTGSTQIGDSSMFGTLVLPQSLALGSRLLALDVIGSGGGWSSSTLQLVQVLPEPAGAMILALAAPTVFARRRGRRSTRN